MHEKSSEIKADISLSRDNSLPLIYHETTTGSLVLQPSAPIKNVFLICSHPALFGVLNQAVRKGDDQIAENDVKIDLKLRATKIGDLNIKFLVRYEVIDAENKESKYRFKRIELNLMVKEMF